MIAFLLFAALATEYTIQPAQGGKFQLTVEKTGLFKGKKHVFEFGRYQGAVRFDPEQPAASTVRFEIEASSAVLKDQWLNEKDFKKVHQYALQDMLDAAHHPQLVFQSTRVEAAGSAQYRVAGTLVVRGISKPCEVMVTVKEQNGGLLLLEGRAVIRITDFGLKPPSAALGAIGTRNEMEVAFTLTALPASK
jgi:polyisoprenoid-binding protein YceI